MTKLTILTANCSALVALAACGGATAGDKGAWKASSYGYGDTQLIGSGELVTESRAIGSFDRLAIDGPVDVVIRQGATRSLVITAEDNLIDLVRARSEGGTLSLDTNGSFRTRIGIRAVLTVPRIDAVAINASGDVQFDGWNARAIDLAIRGSGDIELGGEVSDVRALIGGSGDIDLAPARLSYVDADIEGSGEIRMGSLRKLDATLNGSGMIEAGDVGELDAVLNGSGEIRYRSAKRIRRLERNGSGRIARR